MKRLIAAELKKLTTTRTIYLLFAGVVAIAMISTIDPDHSAATFEKPFHEQSFVFFSSLLTRILILVLGIRVMTDEFRHGTIVPSLLAAPKRSHLVAAKSIAVAATGAALAVVAWAAMVATATVIANSDGTTLAFDPGAWRSLGGTVVAGATWGVIGLGLGAMIRNQVVAIVGGLVWLMGLEDVVKGFLGGASGYLPGQAGLSLALGPSVRAVLLGVATMAAYAVIMMLAGDRVMRRDVS